MRDCILPSCAILLRVAKVRTAVEGSYTPFQAFLVEDCTGHLVTLLIWHLPLKDTGKAWIPLFLIAKSAKLSKFVPHSSMVLG